MKEYSRIVRLSPFEREHVYDENGNECTIVKDIFTYNLRGRYVHLRYEVPTQEELEEFDKNATKDIIALGLSFIGIMLMIATLLLC